MSAFANSTAIVEYDGRKPIAALKKPHFEAVKAVHKKSRAAASDSDDRIAKDTPAWKARY